MSAEIEIIGNCSCGQKLDLEIDFVDGEVVLSIKPCDKCIKKALEGLVYNTLENLFQSPKYVTPQEADELESRKNSLRIEKKT